MQDSTVLSHTPLLDVRPPGRNQDKLVRYCVASCINHLGRGTRSIITSWCRTTGSGHRQREFAPLHVYFYDCTHMVLCHVSITFSMLMYLCFYARGHIFLYSNIFYARIPMFICFCPYVFMLKFFLCSFSYVSMLEHIL